MCENSEQKEKLDALLLDVPKVDLHCHLNGSISSALLNYLQWLQKSHSINRISNIHNNNPNTDKYNTNCETEQELSTEKTQDDCNRESTVAQYSYDNKIQCTQSSLTEDTKRVVDPQTRMHECFKTFDLIYNIMDNLTFTKLAVQDLLFHAAMEKVCVLEIRTSLRDALWASYNKQTTTTTTKEITIESKDHNDKDANNRIVTKEQYLQTVINTVEHLLSGQGVVCFTSGVFLKLNEMSQNKIQEWEAQYMSIYKSSFLHNTLCLYNTTTTTTTITNNNNMCEVLNKRILPHLHKEMHVRLLVSVNRGKSVAESDEAVTLAMKLQRAQVQRFYFWLQKVILPCHDKANEHEETCNKLSVKQTVILEKLRQTCWITGIDFAGNCYKNAFCDYTASLSRVKQKHIFNDINNILEDESENTEVPINNIPVSLAVTLHAGEKYDDDELQEMITFEPERFGHLVFIHNKKELLLEQILNKGTGIELCMSSNLVTCGHTTAEHHHIGPLLQLWWNQEAKQKDREQMNNKNISQGDVDDVVINLKEAETSKRKCSMQEILLSPEKFAYSEELRIKHRLSRWNRGKEEEVHQEEHHNKEENNVQQEEELVWKQRNTNVITKQTHNAENSIKESVCRTLNSINDNKDNKDISATPQQTIPNISFHTDDRGVFDISLTFELGLVCSHPLFLTNHSRENNSLQSVTKAISNLERLTLIQVFELPWPVMYLLYQVLHISSNNDTNNDIKKNGNAIKTFTHDLVSSSSSSSSTDFCHTCVISFDNFLQKCNDLFCEEKYCFSEIMQKMSQWELQWLTDGFDRLERLSSLTPIV